MPEDVIQTDMVIIGAGPCGLFAVFEAGLLGMKCQLVDNLDKIGGQCAELYPDKPIYDIPAVPRCTGQELVDLLMAQIRPFEPQFHLKQQASALTRLPDGRWRLETDLGTVIEAPVVVIAAGAGSFVPRRLPLPGAERFEGSSLFYAVRKMEQFRGRRILVAGGGDSALDWVLEPGADRGRHGAGASPRRVPGRPRFGREDAAPGRRRADGAGHRPDLGARRRRRTGSTMS